MMKRHRLMQSLAPCLCIVTLTTVIRAQEPAETPAEHAGHAAEEIQKLLKGLPVGTPGEYERIPGIWQIAIAAGKRNDTKELVQVLDVSLPELEKPLYDWQAVVVGGGVVNGVSMAGPWPRERVAELLKDQPELKARWDYMVPLAVTMSHNPKVRDGARYDALRILGTLPYAESGKHLSKYLTGDNAELQQGAVSALVDVNDPEATSDLIEAFSKLTERNQGFAIEGLFRSEERINALRAAVDGGKISKDALSAEQAKQLMLP